MGLARRTRWPAGNFDEIAHGSWATLVGYVRGTAMVTAFDATFIALGFWAQNGTW